MTTTCVICGAPCQPARGHGGVRQCCSPACVARARLRRRRPPPPPSTWTPGCGVCGMEHCRYWDHAHGCCALPPAARELADGQEHTLDQIAKRFGLTRERIRQIEAVALRKLRRRLLARGIDDTDIGGPACLGGRAVGPQAAGAMNACTPHSLGDLAGSPLPVPPAAGRGPEPIFAGPPVSHPAEPHRWPEDGPGSPQDLPPSLEPHRAGLERSKPSRPAPWAPRRRTR